MSDEIPEEVRRKVSLYLEEDALSRWWESPIPALDGQTPKETWEVDPDLVRQLIGAYESGAYL